MGRLTKDPEIRYSQGENSMAVARFTLAVARKKVKKEGEQEADFFTCVAFGKQAEFCEKYLKKGTKIIAIGRMQTGSYTNKEGAKVYTTELMVEELEFAESKATAGDQATPQATAPQAQAAPAPQPVQAQMPIQPQQFTDPPQGFMNIPTGLEAELPFEFPETPADDIDFFAGIGN